MDTDALTPTERDVLVTPGWPKGVCPIHTWGEDGNRRCFEWCMATRVAFRQLSDEMDRYWEHPDVQRTLRREREMVA